MNDTQQDNVSEYWDNFYSSAHKSLSPPSQFAAFVLGEVDKNCLVVDVGCGTGRDALFFASQGFSVLGIDRSGEAVSLCERTADRLGLNARFVASSVQDLSVDTLRENTDSQERSVILVYARFFLHAITEEDENALLAWIKTLALNHQVRIAVEFRTDRDASLPKSTAQHYRRFINPTQFVAKVVREGFEMEYFVEGFGFAKYKNDDADVARCLAGYTP